MRPGTVPQSGHPPHAGAERRRLRSSPLVGNHAQRGGVGRGGAIRTDVIHPARISACGIAKGRRGTPGNWTTSAGSRAGTVLLEQGLSLLHRLEIVHAYRAAQLRPFREPPEEVLAEFRHEAAWAGIGPIRFFTSTDPQRAPARPAWRFVARASGVRSRRSIRVRSAALLSPPIAASLLSVTVWPCASGSAARHRPSASAADPEFAARNHLEPRAISCTCSRGTG